MILNPVGVSCHPGPCLPDPATTSMSLDAASEHDESEFELELGDNTGAMAPTGSTAGDPGGVGQPLGPAGPTSGVGGAPASMISATGATSPPPFTRP